jgi:hypothetical protein
VIAAAAKGRDEELSNRKGEVEDQQTGMYQGLKVSWREVSSGEVVRE